MKQPENFADRKDVRGIEYKYHTSDGKTCKETIWFDNVMIRDDAVNLFTSLAKQKNISYVNLLVGGMSYIPVS